MSETVNRIASVSHMGTTYFYNPKPAHKNIGNFRYFGRSSNIKRLFTHRFCLVFADLVLFAYCFIFLWWRWFWW